MPGPPPSGAVLPEPAQDDRLHNVEMALHKALVQLFASRSSQPVLFLGEHLLQGRKTATGMPPAESGGQDPPRGGSTVPNGP